MTAAGIPAPRDGSATGETTVLQYVAGTVGRLEENLDRGFREIRETLANHYVPRNEIDRRFDDVKLDVAALEGRMKLAEDRAALAARDRQARLEQAGRERELADRQAARERELAERQAELEAAEAAREARRDRWQRIGLLTSSAVALIGTASGVVLHFS